MYRFVIALLLTGCAMPPERNDGLVEVAIKKTPQQIEAENEEDLRRVKQTQEWQAYVCSQPLEEQRRLIQKTLDEQGWQMMCPRKPRS